MEKEKSDSWEEDSQMRRSKMIYGRRIL